MIVLEQSVTKRHWEPMYDYIVRRLNTDRYQRIPGTQVIRVFGGANTRTYTVLSNEHETYGQPIAWLYLARRPGWVAWEIHQVWVFPDWRNTGLAAKIYTVAVNKDKILLASGKTQSKSARALWRKLIAADDLHIWAQDFNNLDLTSAVVLEDDEVHCNLELYARRSSKHDVRLIATRKTPYEFH